MLISKKEESEDDEKTDDEEDDDFSDLRKDYIYRKVSLSRVADLRGIISAE